MALQPFSTWAKRQQVKIPEPDRLISLIKQAGPRGLTRAEIGGAIDMDREFLDEFLAGLVQAGVLRMLNRGGVRTYWAV